VYLYYFNLFVDFSILIFLKFYLIIIERPQEDKEEGRKEEGRERRKATYTNLNLNLKI
jgi:hypothetical protein